MPMTLRPIRLEDWDAVHGWAQLIEVCRYQPWGPNTPEQTYAFVQLAIEASPLERLPHVVVVDGRRVMTKLGMTHQGRLRQNVLIRDGWRDSDVYSILASEWNSAVTREG